MTKIATPVSDLFSVEDQAREIIARSDCLEGRPRTLALDYPGQLLFHCDEVQPIHRMGAEQFAYIETVKRQKPELKLMSFHCASVCDAPVLGHGGRVWESVGGREYSVEEMKQNVRDNIPKIKTILGPGIALAIENNNYYPTPAYAHVTDPDLIAAIVRENDIQFLLDIAHAEITCANAGILDFEDYLARLPMERLAQVHISRHEFDRELNWTMDAHEYPTDATWATLKSILARWPAAYLTVEYYKNVDRLIASLQSLRALLL